MFGRTAKRTSRGVLSHGANRNLRFESLENRLLLTRAGVIAFGFDAPYDVTTVEGVRIEGEASFAAEFTFLNSGDLTQVSQGINEINATGLVSETFEGLPILGTVSTNVGNVDYNLAPNAAGIVGLDATADGTFSAVITVPAPDPPVNSTGQFTINFLGTVDLTTQTVTGDLSLDILTDDGEIDENFIIDISTSVILLPDSFTLPDTAKGSVSGLVWLDADRDGQRNEAASEEFRGAGIMIELVDANSSDVVATTAADRFGGYSFIDVEAGDYHVRFKNIPRGNQFTTIDIGSDASDSDADSEGDTANIPIAVGQNDVNVDAGVVSGSVFQNLFNRRDADGNGVFNLRDVFQMIDHLRSNGTGVLGTLPDVKDPDDLFLDVDGNGRFTLVDLFDAIDGAREQISGSGDSGEGEAAILGSRDERFGLDPDLLDLLANGR